MLFRLFRYQPQLPTASHRCFPLEVPNVQAEMGGLPALQEQTKAGPGPALLSSHEMTCLPLLCPKMTDNEDSQLQLSLSPFGDTERWARSTLLTDP